MGYQRSSQDNAPGPEQSNAFALDRRLLATRQRMYIVLAGLAVLVALPLLAVGLGARPVPSHLTADGFSFDMCYLPGELPLHRIWPSAVPGNLAVEYRNEGGQPHYMVEDFQVQPHSLVSTGRYAWTQPMGELAVLSWPAGKVMCSVMLDPAEESSGDLVMRQRQLPEFVDGAQPTLAAPVQNLRFATAHLRSPETAVSDSQHFVEIYQDDADPHVWSLAECDAGQAAGVERKLRAFYLHGQMWLDGRLTLALVTDDSRLLGYDFSRHDFVEQPQLAAMAQQLHQHAAAQSEFWLGDGFALCTTSAPERLLVAADGRTHTIGAIQPLIQQPDGSRRSWLSQVIPLLGRQHTAATAQADYERTTRQWVAEGHRVPADHASGMSHWQVLVDPQTIAIFDTEYRRITLVRLAPH